MSAEKDIAELHAAVHALQDRVTAIECFPAQFAGTFQEQFAEPFSLREEPDAAGDSGQSAPGGALTVGGVLVEGARPAPIPRDDQ